MDLGHLLESFVIIFTALILKPLIYITWAYKNKIKYPPHTHTHTVHVGTSVPYTYSITLYFRLAFSHKRYLVNVFVLTQRPIKWLIC
jgi:hypothetical protein